MEPPNVTWCRTRTAGLGETAPAQDCAELAEGEGWDAEGIRCLLDVLVPYDLLAKENDHYRLVPMTETYLLPDRPTYMGEGLLIDMDWEGKGTLAQALQRGQRPIPQINILGSRKRWCRS